MRCTIEEMAASEEEEQRWVLDSGAAAARILWFARRGRTAGSSAEGRACGRDFHDQPARALDRLEVVVCVEAVCVLVEGVDGDQLSAGVRRGADDALECVEEQLCAQALPMKGSSERQARYEVAGDHAVPAGRGAGRQAIASVGAIE